MTDDKAVSRGPAGAFMYSFEPIRQKASEIQTKHPHAIVRFWCQLNNCCVAGFIPHDNNEEIDLVLGLGGFLTKPVRMQ